MFLDIALPQETGNLMTDMCTLIYVHPSVWTLHDVQRMSEVVEKRACMSYKKQSFHACCKTFERSYECMCLFLLTGSSH